MCLYRGFSLFCFPWELCRKVFIFSIHLSSHNGLFYITLQGSKIMKNPYIGTWPAIIGKIYFFSFSEKSPKFAKKLIKDSVYLPFSLINFLANLGHFSKKHTKKSFFQLLRPRCLCKGFSLFCFVWELWRKVYFLLDKWI